MGTGIVFWAHGGAREPAETIAPSYEAERQFQTLSGGGDAALAPWVAHERYAPPGPGLTYLPTLRLVLPLFGAVHAYTLAPAEPPEALLDEPTVLQRIADLVEAEDAEHIPAIELDEPAEDSDAADQEFLDDEALPLEWLPPEPAEPFKAVEVEPPPLPEAEEAAPQQAKVLSWLDSRLRSRQNAQPDLPIEAQFAPSDAPAASAGESSVVGEAPPESLAGLQSLAPQPPPGLVASPDLVEREPQAEPQLLAPQPVAPSEPVESPEAFELASEADPQLPAPQPVAPPEPVETPEAIEPHREIQDAPERQALQPSPLPIAPPSTIRRPIVADAPRLRRFESRLPKRSPLPSLFKPSTDRAPAQAAVDAPRLRKFGLRLWRRPPGPSVTPPSSPTEAPVAAEVAERRAFRSPTPAEPAPPAETPPLPSVVHDLSNDQRDVPTAAAPETLPPPVIPPHDLPPLPSGIVQDDISVEPTPERLPVAPAPPEATDSPAPRPAAYWAESNWAKSDQTNADQPESLAWTPPPSAGAGLPGARRTTPAMEGLWRTESVGAAEPGSAVPGQRRRVVRRVASVGAGVVVLAVASAAVLRFLPGAFVSNLVPAATFNAPMMVLRANGPGRVVSITVQNGQAVDPNTLLLTIRTDPQPDPAAALLRARLDAAQARLSDLDQSLAQATPATDAGRTRIADLRRQRAAAVIDVAQLQDGVTNIPAAKSSDLPVKAGVHGVIRSLEARTGTVTAAGIPLVRMLDCDHAFLTVGPESKLQAGQAVQVRLPNLPPIAATVRQSAGIAEPPDSLVIATPPGAFVGQLSGSCPIGATATVTPSITGS